MENLNVIFNFIKEARKKNIPAIYELLYNINEKKHDWFGSLDLTEYNKHELPDNLTVHGNLYLAGLDIKSLPNNLTVYGYLDMSLTLITDLPDNLIVYGRLYCRNTPFMRKISHDKRLEISYYKKYKIS